MLLRFKNKKKYTDSSSELRASLISGSQDRAIKK
jgi:hypothetical protein